MPDSQPSVRELHRVEARTASAQTLLILLEAHDPAVLRAMGNTAAAKLRQLGPDIVSSAEDGTQAARAFLTPRAGLFLSVPELEQLRDDVFARWDYEVAKEAGELLDDSGPPVTIEQIEKRFKKKADAAGAAEDHSDGYYARKDGTGLVVVVRSPIAGGDLAKTGPALEKMEGVVAAVKASDPSYAQVRVGYAGDMATGFIEYDRIRNDLLGVGAKGIALVLSAVLLYFMRLRALLVMGITIAVGLVWTLGFTQIFIGHLNVATGFLISIIAGNGINVGILYQSRYFEERRRGASAPDALRTSVRATWQPTVIAALAAAASYLSLLVTDFRAFKYFGVIAAMGMLLCWVVKTLMVPPLLVLLERRRPMSNTGTPRGLPALRDGLRQGLRVARAQGSAGVLRGRRAAGRRRGGGRGALHPPRPHGIRPRRNRQRPERQPRAAPGLGRGDRDPRSRPRGDGGPHGHAPGGQGAAGQAPGRLGPGARARQALRRACTPFGARSPTTSRSSCPSCAP